MLPITEIIVLVSCVVLVGLTAGVARTLQSINRNSQETVCLLRSSNRMLALLLEQKG